MLILVIILLAVALGSNNLSKTSKESLTYTELLTKIEAQEVERLRIYSSDDEVAEARVSLTTDPIGTPEKIVNVYESAFMAYLNGLPEDIRSAMDVETIAPPQPNILMSMLPTLMIIGLLLFVLMFFMQQMQGGG